MADKYQPITWKKLDPNDMLPITYNVDRHHPVEQ